MEALVVVLIVLAVAAAIYTVVALGGFGAAFGTGRKTSGDRKRARGTRRR